MQRLPVWLKVAYLLFLAVWIPAYWAYYPPSNFLWLCDVANLLLGVAILTESALLVSSQAVSVLVIQICWVIDFGGALAFGSHPLGGTEYMFDPAKPLWVRGLSLFHVVVPPLLLWCLWRLGYDRAGWKLQTLIAWLVLPVSLAVGDPEQNLNWLWKPFGVDQTWMAPGLFLGVAMLAYPLLLYLPTHAALRALARRTGRYL